MSTSNPVSRLSKRQAQAGRLRIEQYYQEKLADMVASPIARHYLGKPERIGQQLSYNSVFSKVRNINGRWENIGITILPRN
jgi:hypothetical protein